MYIPYEELRRMKNPITQVSKYYRSQLGDRESFWWAGDSGNEVVPAKIRLWNNIPADERRKYTIYGCVNFMEILEGNYDRYALWLTSQGAVDSHIRD